MINIVIIIIITAFVYKKCSVNSGYWSNPSDI